MTVSKRTPLHAIHVDLGATLTDFAGWSMPLRYASELQEHHAVRRAAGLFDLSHMGQIEIVGPDAAEALDFALVGRASKVQIGRARYSMVCDRDGGIVDDVILYRLAEDHYLVVANAANVSVVLAVLKERSKRYGSIVRDVSRDWSLIAIQGPAAATIVGELCHVDVPDLKYYAIDKARLANRDVLLARTGYTGEDGFEVYCTPGDAVEVWTALIGTGQRHGLVPAGLASRDTLRLEAGMPLYGRELDRTVTPYEAGLGRVVVFDKPDGFAGGPALERRHSAGAAKTLVGLKADGHRSPRCGYQVVDPATGRSIGTVTSGAPSPTLGYPIALAYVPVSFEAPGTRLAVDVRGALVDVEVIALPFYRRTT